MKIGDPVKLSKKTPVDLHARGIGFVITSPYAFVFKEDESIIETKVVDVLFGVDKVEKIPLECLEIIF